MFRGIPFFFSSNPRVEGDTERKAAHHANDEDNMQQHFDLPYSAMLLVCCQALNLCGGGRYPAVKPAAGRIAYRFLLLGREPGEAQRLLQVVKRLGIFGEAFEGVQMSGATTGTGDQSGKDIFPAHPWLPSHAQGVSRGDEKLNII